MKYLFLLLWLPACLAAQTEPNRQSQVWQLSYQGSLIYPGAKAGLLLPLSSKPAKRPRPNGYTTKDKYLGLHLGYYHHPTFHDNAYLYAAYTLRRTKPGGLYLEMAPGLGYSRTILPLAYQVNNSGEISRRRWAGFGYYAFHYSLALGQEFSVGPTAKLGLFFRPSLLVMFPYNTSVFPRPTLEIGAAYRRR